MLNIPPYKLGDIFECMNEHIYNKIQIIKDGNVIILEGYESGLISSFVRWILWAIENKLMIRNINNNTIFYLENITTDIIRSNSTKSVTFDLNINIIKDPIPIKKKLKWYNYFCIFCDN